MASAARLLRAGKMYAVHLNQMAQTVAEFQHCIRCGWNQNRLFSQSARKLGIFEPDDLKLEPDIPEYPTLNLRMRGYDFIILESYAKYVHGLVDSLGIDSSAWAVPARSKDISTYKPNSTVVDHKYSLKVYERTVQIHDVPSPKLPLIVEMMKTHAPEGVTVTVKEPDAEEEEFRYIPDKEMIELRQQIKAIDDAKEERRSKK